MDKKYFVELKCPSCGKIFTKSKYHAKNNQCCRKCNMNKTYSENPEKLKIALDKRKKSCLETYGVENVAQNEQVKQKYKNTQIEKYGGVGGFSFANEKVQAASHSPEANNKRIETCLKHFGTTHQMKNKEFCENLQKNLLEKYGTVGPVARYKFLDILFDSSWEIAYFIWLSDNNKDFIYHPKLFFEYTGDDGELHKYYPDFLIEGKFYEIKGDQFFNEKNEPYNQYKKEYWWEKYNALKDNNVTILRYQDIKFAIDYVNKTYGNKLLKECKIKK